VKYPVMEVDRLPVGVISRIKGTTVFIEFIGEDKDHLAAIFVGWYVIQVGGGVLVDQTKVPNIWYLTGFIGGDAVPTIAGGFVRGKVYNDGVSSTGSDVAEDAKIEGARWNSQQSDHPDTDEDKGAEVY